MASKDIKFSLIVINWNGKELLKRCMPSVVKAAEYTGKEHEIIVVDNGSEDGSVSFLSSNFPEIRTVCLDDNKGFIKASNIGAKKSRGNLLVFLNNDIILEEDSIEQMLGHFENPNVFGVSPKLVKWDKNTIELEFSGCDFVFGTLVHNRPNMGEIDSKEFKEPRLTSFAPGGASVIDKKKFLELGGFDDIYSPFYMEDVDLSYRAYKRGWICLYEPNAVFYHKHRGTLGKAFTEGELQLQELKNRFIFTWSNFSDPLLLFKHFLFLPLVFLRSAFLTKYRSERFLDLRAFFQALGYLGEIKKKREKLKKNTKLSDKEVLELIGTNKAKDIDSTNFLDLVK